MNGWMGKVLHINLSDKTCSVESPAGGLYQKWVGGKGLAGHYLSPHVTLSYDEPGMPLVFMTGPLVGTASPTSGRMCVMSRSPLTGTIGDASVGGTLATHIKKAGFDGFVITGCSDSLCGIEIVDAKITFHEAPGLAGKTTGQLHDSLKAKGAVAVTGPAADNGVMFSSIMVDGVYAIGRNGLGLVFAAKNLKYVTVKGSGKVSVHDRDGIANAKEEIFRLIASSPVLLGEHGIAHYGTGAIYDLMHSRRMMPTANFSKTYFDRAPAMNAVAYKKKYETKRTGCRGCHILCKKIGKDGTHIPEFETMSHFSALLENEDIEIVTKANEICNQMGMDTITAAATLACYSEVGERRLSGAQILSLLNDIALGRGEGAELGQGSYRYAESKGCAELSISVKKQELPAYDPRGAYGMALAYATSTRGGCHLRAYPISHEILRKPVATDRFSFSGKARIIKISEDLNAVVDSLTACKFVFFASSLEEYAKAYTAVTGVDTTAQDLLKLGERIYYNERIMNARNGFTSKDDDLPPRFFTEAGTSGNEIEVKPLDRDEFLKARANYYKVRGLDEDGIPTEEKAEELGI